MASEFPDIAQEDKYSLGKEAVHYKRPSCPSLTGLSTLKGRFIKMSIANKACQLVINLIKMAKIGQIKTNGAADAQRLPTIQTQKTV
jgi:hypothetical protein